MPPHFLISVPLSNLQLLSLSDLKHRITEADASVFKELANYPYPWITRRWIGECLLYDELRLLVFERVLIQFDEIITQPNPLAKICTLLVRFSQIPGAALRLSNKAVDAFDIIRAQIPTNCLMDRIIGFLYKVKQREVKTRLLDWVIGYFDSTILSQTITQQITYLYQLYKFTNHYQLTPRFEQILSLSLKSCPTQVINTLYTHASCAQIINKVRAKLLLQEINLQLTVLKRFDYTRTLLQDYTTIQHLTKQLDQPCYKPYLSKETCRHLQDDLQATVTRIAINGRYPHNTCKQYTLVQKIQAECLGTYFNPNKYRSFGAKRTGALIELPKSTSIFASKRLRPNTD